MSSKGTRGIWIAAGYTTWVILFVLSLAIYVGSMYSTSADIGHHGVLVSRLMENWSLPAADANLGAMVDYPRLAHLLASVPGKLAGSALVGMQAVAIASLFILWSAIAGALVALPRNQFLIAAGSLTVLVVANSAVLKLEVFGNELVGNYAFAHFVAQAIVIVALVISLRLEWRTARSMPAFIALGIAIPLSTFAHLLPALELLGTLLILTVLSYAGGGSERKRTFIAGLSVSAVATGLMSATPGVRNMIWASEHEGSTTLRHIDNLMHLSVLATVVLTLSVALLAVWWRFRAAPPRYGDLLAKYLGAFGTSVAGLCLAQVIAFVWLDVGSSYACLKHGIALQSLLVVSAVVFAALCLQRNARGHGTKISALFPAVFGFVACVCVFQPNPGWSTQALIRAERDSRTFARANPARSADLDDLLLAVDNVPSIGNYFVSRAALGARNTALLFEVVTNRHPQLDQAIGRILTTQGGVWDVAECRQGIAGSLHVVDSACVFASMDAIPCSGVIRFSSAGAIDLAVSGLGQAGEQGRWSEGTYATLVCDIPEIPPSHAHLAASALVTADHPQRMLVSVNDGPAEQIDFSAASPSRIVTIRLPASDASVLRFAFSFPDAISPFELGINSDRRKLAVIMHNLRFE